MPKCEHCGFGHAQPDRCVNCGSTDPFPRRRLIKLIVGVLATVIVLALGYYFYERAKYLRLAEEKARAVGERVYEVGVRGREDGAGASQSPDEGESKPPDFR